jgi:hypothetical protein
VPCIFRHEQRLVKRVMTNRATCDIALCYASAMRCIMRLTTCAPAALYQSLTRNATPMTQIAQSSFVIDKKDGSPVEWEGGNMGHNTFYKTFTGDIVGTSTSSERVWSKLSC